MHIARALPTVAELACRARAERAIHAAADKLEALLAGVNALLPAMPAPLSAEAEAELDGSETDLLRARVKFERTLAVLEAAL